MEKYQVKIGSIEAQQWGSNIEAKSFKDLKAKVLDQIENLNPLNSSESGREEYRNRFRNKPIFAKVLYTKTEFKELVD
jgi:hypothetical protein